MTHFILESVTLINGRFINDHGVDSDAGSGFLDDGGIRGIEVGKSGTVDDVYAAWMRRWLAVGTAARASADACDVGGR